VVLLNVLLVVNLILLPILGEVLLRVAIRFDVRGFRDPGIYADSFGDDNYWKLSHEWVSRWTLPDQRWVDPLLGWVQPKSASNPLGIITDQTYVPEFQKPSILFYGDSFVEGLTKMESKIPQLLSSKVGEYTVYNYGQGGYGVDQIFLRFQQSYPLFKKPTIVFGILTQDLDRSILSLRTWQKPYFILKDDQLVLKASPIDLNQPQWVRRNRARVWSYFIAFLNRKISLRRAASSTIDVTYRQSDKERINARLIEEVVKVCHEHDLPLLFVIFYAYDEFERPTWREVFLQEQFKGRPVAYVDTKEVMLRAAQRAGVNFMDYYRVKDGHPNDLGNEIIADAIAEALKTGEARVPSGRPDRSPVAMTHD
jgi:hypothetical protein